MPEQLLTMEGAVCRPKRLSTRSRSECARAARTACADWAAMMVRRRASRSEKPEAPALLYSVRTPTSSPRTRSGAEMRERTLSPQSRSPKKGCCVGSSMSSGARWWLIHASSMSSGRSAAPMPVRIRVLAWLSVSAFSIVTTPCSASSARSDCRTSARMMPSRWGSFPMATASSLRSVSSPSARRSFSFSW